MNLEDAQMTLLVGRTVAALVTAPWLSERAGTIQCDGRRPPLCRRAGGR